MRPKGRNMTSRSLSSAIFRKRAIVFDLFHTLVSLESTWGNNRPRLHEMLGVGQKAFSEQLMLTSHDRLVGKKKDAFVIVAEIAHAIDCTIPDTAIRRTAEHILDTFAGALLQVPAGIREVLTSLRGRGKSIGLVSNASAMEVAGWPCSPIAPLFDSVVFSCFVGSVKPERRIYKMCADQLGVTPEECIFVGDGESKELEGAQNLGMTTVMTTQFIGHMGADKIAERRRHADFVVEELGGLLDDS
jgi:putative hydrolase of the HAD superfamily